MAKVVREALGGRTLIAHNAEFERTFLTRCIEGIFKRTGSAFRDAAFTGLFAHHLFGPGQQHIDRTGRAGLLDWLVLAKQVNPVIRLTPQIQHAVELTVRLIPPPEQADDSGGN